MRRRRASQIELSWGAATDNGLGLHRTSGVAARARTPRSRPAPRRRRWMSSSTRRRRTTIAYAPSTPLTTKAVLEHGTRRRWRRPPPPPSAPQNLQASPGNAQVSLSWSSPSSNGRLGDNRLPRLSRYLARSADRAHPRPRRGDELRRPGAHQRAGLLLPRHRLERRRREPGLERGVGDAGRSCHRPLGSPDPAGEPRQRPGLSSSWSAPSSNGARRSPATASIAAPRPIRRRRSSPTSAW